MTEELNLHLLEFSGAEGEIARRDLVPKALPDLGDPEGNVHARRVAHVLEVDKNALRRLRTQEGGVFFRPHRTDDGLEHQIEFSRRGELTLLVLAGMAARLPRAFAGSQVIRAKAGLALAAVHHHVVEEVVVT